MMLIAIALATLHLFPVSDPVVKVSGIAGQWTHCVAWSHDQSQWNIVNGNNAAYCHGLARRCLGADFNSATHYSSPVIINAPYRICALR